MRVIAKKTDGIVLMYSVLLLIGGMIIVVGVEYAKTLNWLLILAGAAYALISAYHIVKYLFMPHDV